jgi:hypothetical protein
MSLLSAIVREHIPPLKSWGSPFLTPTLNQKSYKIPHCLGGSLNSLAFALGIWPQSNFPHELLSHVQHFCSPPCLPQHEEPSSVQTYLIFRMTFFMKLFWFSNWKGTHLLPLDSGSTVHLFSYDAILPWVHWLFRILLSPLSAYNQEFFRMKTQKTQFRMA